MVTKRLPTKERRAQIAEEALKIVALHGQSGLTLVALGDAVGIADASVLRHFKDKQAIVDAAVARFGALLNEDLTADIEDPMRRLGAFFVRRLAKVRARPELMALAYNTRLRDAAGEDASSVDVHIARSANFIRVCVDEAQAQGALKAAVPVHMWMWIVAGLLRGASMGLPGPLGSERERATLSPERTWELLEHIMRSA